jgi:hypothetical protein
MITQSCLMIVTLLSWVYILFITCSLGLICFELWKKFWPRASALLPAATLLSLTGFCLLAALLGIYSLFLPITQTTSFTLFFLLLVYAFWRWRSYRLLWHQSTKALRSLAWYWWLFLGVFFVKLLFLSISPPANHDFENYYLQTLKWLENYAVVPGLGNLHGRLAFNSSFFQVSAFFSFYSWLGRPVLAVNGFLYLLLALTISQFSRSGNGFLTAFGLLLLGVPFSLFASWFSSGTPDIAIMGLEVFIFLFLLERIFAAAPGDQDFANCLLLLLIFTCLTIKLSSLPIAGAIVYLVYTRQIAFSRKWLFLVLGLVSVILVPWLVRNVIQTGYLIYPLPDIDLFDFDWKVPQRKVIFEKEFILYFARAQGVDWSTVVPYSFSDWFPVWWKGLRPEFQGLFLAALVSPFALAVLSFLRSRQKKTVIPFVRPFFVWLVSFSGVVFWFYNAPEPRFGIVFILFSGLLPLFFWLQQYLLPYYKPVTVAVVIIFAAITLTGLRDDVYQLRHNTARVREQLVLPAKIGAAPLESEYVGSIKVWVPMERIENTGVRHFCWDAPLPCTQEFDATLELRGRDIAEGFRIRKADKNAAGIK